MAKYKVIFDKETCIAAASCSAVYPEVYLRGKDSKALLKNSKYNEKDKVWELIIDEKEFIKHKEAEEVCPVNAIKVIKIE